MPTVFLSFVTLICTCLASIRLKVNGPNIVDPVTNDAIHLHGFNWILHDVESGDTATYRQYAPNANLVRMIGILWDDSLASSDCMTNDASEFMRRADHIRRLILHNKIHLI